MISLLRLAVVVSLEIAAATRFTRTIQRTPRDVDMLIKAGPNRSHSLQVTSADLTTIEKALHETYHNLPAGCPTGVRCRELRDDIRRSRDEEDLLHRPQ